MLGIIFFIITIAGLIFSIWSLTTIYEMHQIGHDKEQSVKVIIPKKTDGIAFCVILVLLPVMGYVSIHFMDFLERIVALIIVVFLWGVLVYGLIQWLDGIILYEEKGFSLGCIPSFVNYYYYEDVTDVVYNKFDYAIFMDSFRISSKMYKDNLDTFRDLILQKRKDMKCKYIASNEMDMPLSWLIREYAKQIGYWILFLLSIAFQFLDFWYAPLLFKDGAGIAAIVVLVLLEDCISIYLLFKSMAYFAVKGRTCEVTPEGLLVNYPWGKEVCVEWNQFKQICICYRGMNQYQRYETVYKYDPIICFVKHGVKKNIFDRWDVDSINRYKKIIWIDYTEEALQEVKEHCGQKVLDLRRTRQYRTGCTSMLRV